MTRPISREDQWWTIPSAAPRTRVLPPISPQSADSHTTPPSPTAAVQVQDPPDLRRVVRTPLQRWGGRVVGVVVSSFALYVVAPGLATVLGAWPALDGVRPPWFAVL